MKRLVWSDRLSVGVDHIDSQHRCLMGLAGNLLDAIRTDSADDALEDLFGELTEYAATHFRDEELYMQEVGYPRADAHKKKHDTFKKQIADYRQALKANRDTQPSEVLKFLKGWLVDHIIYEDTQIARFANNKPE